MDSPSACLTFAFAVEKIVGISIDDENNTNYEVQWAPSWVSSPSLRGCEKLIEEFLQQQNMSVKEEPSHDQVLESSSVQSSKTSTSFNRQQQQQQKQQQLQQQQQQQQLQEVELPVQQQQKQFEKEAEQHVKDEEKLQQEQPHQQQPHVEEPADIHCSAESEQVVGIAVVRQQKKKKMNKCEHCGKVFLHPSSLAEHIRTHTGDKPHSCQSCEKCFTTRSALVEHTRTHTGVKPYTCDVCKRSFSRGSTLS